MTILTMKHATNIPNSIGGRLKYEMRKQALTSTELARRAEVKTSFIYDVISGKSANPSTIKLARVADSLGISLAYLAGYESSSGAGTRGNQENGDWITLPVLSPDDGKTLPISNQPGTVQNTIPYHFKKSWISKQLSSNPGDVRVTVMRGDSMDPTLCHHDVVLVDTSRTMPSPPGIFMLYDGFGLVAKRIEYLSDQQPAMVRVISDNPKYSTYECVLEDIRIVGRVIWFSREM
jgi:phage repressor protein C with HTH and peptisase S24 domain